MTSLEKLLREIEAQSRQEQEKILLEARAEAEEIEAQGRSKSAEHSAKIIEKAQLNAKTMSERDAAARRIKYRNEILSLKQSIIDGAIDNAKTSVGKLDDEEYFNLLKSWAFGLDVSGSVTVHLNKRDLVRNMGNFLERFPKTVGTVELSKDPVDITGGFLVECGGITINCSLNAMFDAYSDNIRNNLQQMFFE